MYTKGSLRKVAGLGLQLLRHKNVVSISLLRIRTPSRIQTRPPIGPGQPTVHNLSFRDAL